MIWHSIANGYPEVNCKCEALVEGADGNLRVFFCEYDILMGLFLIPGITEEISADYGNVLYWRAL